MASPLSSFHRESCLLFLKVSMLVFLSCNPHKANSCGSNSVSTPIISASEILSSLQKLPLEGYISLEGNENAANDFGNIYHFPPLAVLHPKSVSDISHAAMHVFEMGSASGLKIAARGHGHSLQGQAQAHQGLVINMESLKGQQEMKVQSNINGSELAYVDVSGGELWIDILHETLKHGLAPKSWTDYLHLTVGGTLSNAGISGQAFRHGPQIDNVYQLEVVTGNVGAKQNLVHSLPKWILCYGLRPKPKSIISHMKGSLCFCF